MNRRSNITVYLIVAALVTSGLASLLFWIAWLRSTEDDDTTPLTRIITATDDFQSPEPTVTATITQTYTNTPTATHTPTRAATDTPTVTPSPTLTPTLTPSETATITPSHTPTHTPYPNPVVNPIALAETYAGEPIEITGQALPGDTLILFDNGDPIMEVLADENGAWQISLDEGLSAGSHLLEMLARSPNDEESPRIPLGFVVNVAPTDTPTATATPSFTPTDTATATVTPSATRTRRPSATPSATATEIAQLPTETATQIPPPTDDPSIVEGIGGGGEIASETPTETAAPPSPTTIAPTETTDTSPVVENQETTEATATEGTTATEIAQQATDPPPTSTPTETATTTPTTTPSPSPSPTLTASPTITPSLTPTPTATLLPLAAPRIDLPQNPYSPYAPVIIQGSAEPDAELVISINGEILGQALADENGAWQFSWSQDVESGVVTVIAMSPDGRESPAAQANFAIEATAPEITAPSTGQTVTPQTTITLSGTAPVQAPLTIQTQDGTVLASTSADLDGAWSIDLTLTDTGTYDLRAALADQNISSNIVRITVAELIAPQTGAILSDDDPETNRAIIALLALVLTAGGMSAIMAARLLSDRAQKR